MAAKTKRKKWISFMTTLNWADVNTQERIQNWSVVNAETVADNIPAVQLWARQHVHLLCTHEDKAGFKNYFFVDDIHRKPHDYTLKEYAVRSLAAVYNFQREIYNDD